MDITSYLLGKNAGGGSGSGGLDWSAIGYASQPKSILDDYNYSKNIYDNWDATQTSLENKFKNNYVLTYMPAVDTSNITNMMGCFYGCYSLNTIPMLDTSKVTNMKDMFNGCYKIKEIPLFDTSRATAMNTMFNNCQNLETIPQFNLGSVSTVNSMLSNCISLTDQSLDNVLKMCININPNYSRTKTLAQIGFNATNYPTSRIEALPHYQDFINAGWTIGY